MAEDRGLEGREPPAWARSDEAHPEREAEWRSLLAELDALRADLARVTGERDEATAELGTVDEEIDALREAHKARVSAVEKERDALAARLDAIGDGESSRGAFVAEWQRTQVAEMERDDERAKANEWLAQAHDARAQLAALHEAAKVALLYDTDRTLVDLRGAPIKPGTGPFAHLRAALADEETAARAVAGVTEERDTLAAALVEVRDAVLGHREAMRYAREDGALEAWGTRAKVITDAYERVTRALSALPADLAAQRDARVRAEALRALIPPYDVMSDVDITEWLADEAERGGR